MMQDNKKQTGCCLGTFCLVVLIIIVLALLYGVLMGVLNVF